MSSKTSSTVVSMSSNTSSTFAFPFFATAFLTGETFLTGDAFLIGDAFLTGEVFLTGDAFLPLLLLAGVAAGVFLGLSIMDSSLTPFLAFFGVGSVSSTSFPLLPLVALGVGAGSSDASGSGSSDVLDLALAFLLAGALAAGVSTSTTSTTGSSTGTSGSTTFAPLRPRGAGLDILSSLDSSLVLAPRRPLPADLIGTSSLST